MRDPRSRREIYPGPARWVPDPRSQTSCSNNLVPNHGAPTSALQSQVKRLSEGMVPDHAARLAPARWVPDPRFQTSWSNNLVPDLGAPTTDWHAHGLSRVRCLGQDACSIRRIHERGPNRNLLSYTRLGYLARASIHKDTATHQHQTAPSQQPTSWVATHWRYSNDAVHAPDRCPANSAPRVENPDTAAPTRPRVPGPRSQTIAEERPWSQTTAPPSSARQSQTAETERLHAPRSCRGSHIRGPRPHTVAWQSLTDKPSICIVSDRVAGPRPEVPDFMARPLVPDQSAHTEAGQLQTAMAQYLHDARPCRGSQTRGPAPRNAAPGSRLEHPCRGMAAPDCTKRSTRATPDRSANHMGRP